MENKFFLSIIDINDSNTIISTISFMKGQQLRRKLHVIISQRMLVYALLLLLSLQYNNNYSVVLGKTTRSGRRRITVSAILTPLLTTFTINPLTTSSIITKLTKRGLTTSICKHHHHYYDCRHRHTFFFITNSLNNNLLKFSRSYNNNPSIPTYYFVSLLRQKSFLSFFPSNRHDNDNNDDNKMKSDFSRTSSKDENMISNSRNHKNRLFYDCITTKSMLRSIIVTMIILITGLIGWNQDYNVAAMTTMEQSTTTTTTTTTSDSIKNDSIDISNNNNNNIVNINQIRKIGIKEKYWIIQNDGTNEERIQTNRQLIDSIVTTIMTMYYDYTGGALFDPNQYYRLYKNYMKQSSQIILSSHDTTIDTVQNVLLLKTTLHDPFAKYLSKNDLYNELHSRNDGFLGLGAIVEVPGYNPFIEDISIISSSSTNNNNKNNDDDDGSKQSSSLSSSSSSKTRIPRKVTESLSFLRYLQKETLTVNYNDWIHHHNILSSKSSSKSSLPSSNSYYLSSYMIQNLPIVTGIVPYSPAERSGITVGDRIIAIQDDSFLSLSRTEVNMKLQNKYSSELNQYFGYTELTIAKPISPIQYDNNDNDDNSIDYNNNDNTNIIQSYRPIRVQLPTIAASSSSIPFILSDNDMSQQQQKQENDSPEILVLGNNQQDDTTTVITAGGNNIVRWQLLNDQDSIFIDDNNNVDRHPNNEESQQQQKVPNGYEQNLVSLTIDETTSSSIANNKIDSLHSIFSKSNNEDDGHRSDNDRNGQISKNRVGYIRLTRFSPSATTGFIDAIEHLEKLGATSYIIDIRNNYGGLIQSAMVLASSLLRDPHDVICFTMNSRGGFMPHIVEAYIFHPKYPGYLLSEESKDVTINQVKTENPAFFDQSGWSPPSEFASLREQYIKRGIKKGSNNQFHMKYDDILVDMSSPSLPLSVSADNMIRYKYKELQKPIVVMINEGTASSSEVFASALHDNGRTVALIGTKTYGKGLIQHTFPLIDGGGLRITIAEYLTPALQHVSRIGSALYDPISKKFIGGGIQPDIICDSIHGIPTNIGADLCIGMALDVLDEYIN